MTRKELYEALAAGKVVFSRNTRIAYKYVKDELHKKCFYSGSTQNDWLPSDCTFKMPESVASLYIINEEEL